MGSLLFGEGDEGTDREVIDGLEGQDDLGESSWRQGSLYISSGGMGGLIRKAP